MSGRRGRPRTASTGSAQVATASQEAEIVEEVAEVANEINVDVAPQIEETAEVPDTEIVGTKEETVEIISQEPEVAVPVAVVEETLSGTISAGPGNTLKIIGDTTITVEKPIVVAPKEQNDEEEKLPTSAYDAALKDMPKVEFIYFDKENRMFDSNVMLKNKGRKFKNPYFKK